MLNDGDKGTIENRSVLWWCIHLQHDLGKDLQGSKGCIIGKQRQLWSSKDGTIVRQGGPVESCGAL